MVQILYENENIVIAVKPYGIDSQKEMTELLSKQLDCSILPIHRLDKIVYGIIVYGKNEKSVNAISQLIQKEQFHKEYLAIVNGQLEKSEATLTDLLFHDKQRNKTYVVRRERKGVKQAILHYHVLSYKDDKSLLSIDLKTGRTHQIRIQLANIHHPIVGDGKYGNKENCHCALVSYHLTFKDPFTKEIHDIKIKPENIYPFDLFMEEII